MDQQTIVGEGGVQNPMSGIAKNFAGMQGNLDAIAKYVLYLIAGLLPLWFLPIQIGTEFTREATFGVLIVAAGILWLLSVLASGEIRFQYSLLLWASGLVLAVWALSTFFSLSWDTSLIFSDVLSEKISTLFLGVLLMVLVGSVLRSKSEAAMFLVILVTAGGLSALATVLQLLGWGSVWGLFADFAKDKSFNVVGTMNGLSLFYSALFATAAGMIVSLPLSELKPWVRRALYGSTLLFFITVLLINYSYSWIVLSGVAIVLFGLTFRNVRESRALGATGAGLDWRYIFAICLLVLSIFMYMVAPTIVRLDLPAEVSPALRTTLNIGSEVFNEGQKSSLLGSGPGTFGFDWVKYKDVQVNQTQFWGVRFNQGFSWVLTILPTVGILGLVSILILFGSALFVFVRAITRRGAREESSLGVGPLVGLFAVVIMAFFYPANLTFILLFFALAGTLSYVLSDKHAHEEGVGERNLRNMVMNFSERHIKFESQWAVFISSLVVIFLLSLGVAGAYFELNRLRAASVAQEGILAFNENKLDDATLKLEDASTMEPRNTNFANVLVQVRIRRISNLISRATAGENVQQEFQQEVNRANELIQNATTYLPIEPNLWRTRGALYELIIPFIPGAENLSLESYKKAIAVGPMSPAAYVDFGRAGLTFVDNAQLRIGGLQGADRDTLIKARENVLNEVRSVLEKGVTVKPDFAPAHFLLSQTAIRLGDLPAAIAATENAKNTAPFDIGVAFQLGLLYYQAGNLPSAQAEFERAVGINADYSNARYFLGLIYDVGGRKEDAIKQFERIEVLNPDNQEVKSILTNLRAERGALQNIVPPGTPPQERRAPPVEPGN